MRFYRIAAEVTASFWREAWRLGASLLALAAMSLALAMHLDPAVRVGSGLLWQNVLPLLLCACVVYALCGRLLLSILVSASLIALLYKINGLKLRNLNTPLSPDDAMLGHQVAGHIGFFAHYTGYHAIGLVSAVVLLIACGMLLWRWERRRLRPTWITRAGLLLVSAVALYTLLQGYRPWRALYANHAMCSYQQWNPSYSARSKGFIVTFVRMCQDRQHSVPRPDKALVVNFATRHEEAIRQRESRQAFQDEPDIVVVQSEAFFDPGVLKKVDFGQYTPHFEQLATTGITGSLVTPTYGGGTIRTEFETITAYPMMAFPAVRYPYFGLANRHMPTVPRRLQVLGYTTALFHPYAADFWNRNATMPALGFQYAYYEDAFKDAPRAGLFVADRSLFDAVLAYLGRAGTGPNYVMAITMENHGPWNRNAGKLTRLLKLAPLPAGLSPEGTYEMTYYTSHLLNGDDALADFAQTLMARKRWTLLLFYGDHLPALNAAYSDLGFDDEQDAPQQHTRYMLLSNRPFDPDQQRQLDLAAYDLPGLLFDVAKLPEDGYLALSSVIRIAATHDAGANAGVYRDVLFNAARLEVNCGRTLDDAGQCQ
jgi:phosphoglycerol transferase MdoB-like AlkP superfamily enzyme